jgi:hypothetical protein
LKLVFDVDWVGMGKLELELENYFGIFYKKRMNHKDFPLSTALNKKKVIFVCNQTRRFM